MSKLIHFKIILIIALLSPVYSMASWIGDTFLDPVDGQLDMSNWLLEKQGFLPVPIIITEPAIGYGGGLAMVYFHDKVGAKKGSPPSVSALVGATTENGTWFAGGGHMGIWDNDNIRYTGGLGKGLIKMQYYGLSGSSNSSLQSNHGINFETEATLLLQELQFRLWGSPFFAGIGYLYMDTKNNFKLSQQEINDNAEQSIPGINFDSRSAALSLILNYDTRDNLFTPSNGISAELKLMDFNAAWGSDNDFRRYKASVLSYTKLNDKLVLGLRGDTETVSGDIPFYAYPFIDMRGIKAMRYQGDKTLLGEIELRWEFYNDLIT